jgi:hypothetical protein
VAIAGNPYAAAPYGTVTYVSSCSESWQAGSYASIALNTKTATVAKGTIDFGTSEGTAISVKAQVYLSSGDVLSIVRHDNLSDTSASAKHDWRYLHCAGRGTDKYAFANKCESIANNAYGKNAIVFDYGQLRDAGNQTSVDYGTGYALYYNGVRRLYWATNDGQGGGSELFYRWTLGRVNDSGDGQGRGADVCIGTNDNSGFWVRNYGISYMNMRAYLDTDNLPRTDVRGLRLYARDSTSVYFDLEVSDGVLIVRDHTGANCGEFRRTL